MQMIAEKLDKEETVKVVSKHMRSQWTVRTLVRRYTFTFPVAPHEEDLSLVASNDGTVLRDDRIKELPPRCNTRRLPIRAHLELLAMTSKGGEIMDLAFSIAPSGSVTPLSPVLVRYHLLVMIGAHTMEERSSISSPCPT
jgi:hypothetical protein